MSEEERLDSDADFKPNLVNSVCYLVEQVGGGVQPTGRPCRPCCWLHVGCNQQHHRGHIQNLRAQSPPVCVLFGGVSWGLG